ncbi:metal ABC transporter solute-binding protein, Zn/Mn family [Amnibacterium flavum]|uniref:ABC transporter substrate-binding protein n=1 Tax=Amnibacterium flavum TaxID=2173173 RepID=A0A2V1HS76_9MICO|nr:zinc ABC transporter substrate-binding protein [Amnibacterium flavum]PVZ95453.1 ABC transporter substrate-binding protein [Amnibacterium flavum]
MASPGAIAIPTRRPHVKNPALPLAAAAVLLLSACSTATADDGSIRIVASTDVWGNIASAIAGPDVEVVSIIDSPDKDPHEYEASARDQLAVSRADIVIENGGGYDEFMTTLLAATDADPEVIDAVDLSGLAEDDHDEKAGAAHDEGEHDEGEHEHGEFNEHVWYDLPTAVAVAREVADQLSELDPAGADGYGGRLDEFETGVAALQESVDTIGAADSGAQVAVTEPVPLWLFEAMGLENVTPDEFSEAVEEDSDVPAGVLQDLLTTLESGEVRMLAYNDQSATAQTEIVRTAAEGAGVPVVDFTETLPEGEDYLSWMGGNIERVRDALAAG